MRAIYTTVFLTAAIGLGADAPRAQSQPQEASRAANVLNTLEKIQARLAQDDLTAEERKKLVEALAKAQREIQRAMDLENTQKAEQRDLQERQRQLEMHKRDLDRARAEMEREMEARRRDIERDVRSQQRDLEQAREQLERERVQRQRDLERLERERGDQSEAERVRAERTVARAHAQADQARAEAEEMRRRAVEHAGQARAEAEAVRRRTTDLDPVRWVAEEQRRVAFEAADRAEARAARETATRGRQAPRADSAPAAEPQDPLRGRVRGRVVDSEGRPVRDAVVDVAEPVAGEEIVSGTAPRRIASTPRRVVARLDDVTDAPAAARTNKAGLFVVQEGDTPARIARVWLGENDQWSAIGSANPGVDPRSLRVGQALTVPAPSAPSPSAPQQHVHTHVHHHYVHDGAPMPSPPAIAPSPPAAPGAVAYRLPAGRDAVRPTAGVRAVDTVRAPVAPPVRVRVTDAAPTAPRADEIRAMVDALRAELRDTRELVEGLRRKLAEERSENSAPPTRRKVN